MAYTNGIASGIRLEWVTVDPETAKALLEASVASGAVNRPLNRAQVAKLAEDMRAGNFIKNATPVKFNKTNGLLDGQHRLNAVIESGATIDFLIACGCDDRDILVQDIGVKRSLPEMEYILRGGQVPINTLSLQYATSNIMQRSLRAQNGGVTHRQRKAFFDRHQEAIVWVTGLVGSNASPEFSLGVRLPASVLAVTGRAYYTQDRAKLERFIESVQTGISNPGEEGAAILRTFLLRSANRKGRTGSVGAKEMYGCVLSALQAFLQGKAIKLLRPLKQEIFPLPEELPVGDEEIKLPRARYIKRARQAEAAA